MMRCVLLGEGVIVVDWLSFGKTIRLLQFIVLKITTLKLRLSWAKNNRTGLWAFMAMLIEDFVSNIGL